MRQGWNPPSTERELGRGDWRDSQLERRLIEAAGRFVGIIFPSPEAVVVGDDAGGWFLAIPQDLAGTELIVAHAVVYTPGGSDLVCQVRNVTQAVDMLTDPITVDTGDNSSFTSASPPVIDTANAIVATADIVVVDVDSGDATGLDIILAFA